MGQLIQMPNGKLIEIADGTPPEVVEKIKAQNGSSSSGNYVPKQGDVQQTEVPASQPATRAERRAQGQPRKAETEEQRVNRLAQGRVDDMGDGAYTHFDKAVDGYTFGLANRASAAIAAPINAVRRKIAGDDRGFLDTVGEEYNIGREVRKKQEDRFDQSTGWSGTAAEIAGAVANPIGTGARAVGAGARGIKAAANALNSSRLAGAAANTARAGMRMRRMGGVGQAITAGAVGGALNEAGQGEFEDIPENLAYGAGIGAAGGGLLGGAAHGIRRGIQTIGDKGVKATEREAYRKVSDMLDTANVSPVKAEREIAEAGSGNSDLRLADMAPSLGREASNISIRPNVPRSNNMIQDARGRIDNRRTRFAEEVDNNANLPNNRATQQADAINQRRKNAGAADYVKGGPMDDPLTMNGDVLRTYGNLTRDHLPEVRQALKDAKADGFNIGTHMPDGEVVPSVRTFDYIKRALDDKAQALAQGGNMNAARRIRKQITEIRDTLADQNPKYKEALMAQRSEYEKMAGLEWGQKVISGLTGTAANNPRTLLRELRDLPESAQLDARVGIIDKLLMKESVADPVAFVDKVNRTPEQRKLLVFAFGGEENYSKFFKWVANEAKAKETDRLLAPGYTSDTGAKIVGAAESAAEGAGEVAAATAKGTGFGGPVGGFANAMSAIKNMGRHTTRPQYNEIARILMSKGEGVDEGIKKAAEFYARRTDRNNAVARKIAKGAQQPFTSNMGDR